MLTALLLVSIVADHRIPAIPPGYHLQAYDDCGIDARQPHVDRQDAYNFTFSTTDNDAPEKARSAVFSYKGLHFHYDKLNPAESYVVRLTYATDQVYARTQSLWAGSIQLHDPVALPKGKAIDVIVEIPRESTQNGQLDLNIKIHGEVNATASIVELWSSGPQRAQGSFDAVSGLWGGLHGRLLRADYDGAAQVPVKLRSGARAIAQAITGPDGSFNFPKSTPTALTLEATLNGTKITLDLSDVELAFEPVRYRPIPTRVVGLTTPVQSLDGTWIVNDHGSMQVPGQWKQQGFEFLRDQVVHMKKAFNVPKAWEGKRVFVRFDAIHAGTEYLLNGKILGHSENLFTPVEYELTPDLKFGEVNELELRMKVDTESEALSISSGYAFHNLGGIDRSVRIFALPQSCIRDLKIETDFDQNCRDATLKVSTDIDGPGSLAVRLKDPQGHEVQVPYSSDSGRVDISKRGQVLAHSNVSRILVTNPEKWNAEKPKLYTLEISLLKNGQPTETFERKIGFRKVEIRNHQLYLNGHPIKLAGAGRHEIDPLTGRAGTAKHAREDIALLKGANLNYVRTCHYPPTMEMVEAADELGMYLEVEAPFCWAAPGDDPKTVRNVLSPTSAMVDYYQSHPSVIIWSIANESTFTPTFETSARMVKALDPTRITTFNNPDPKGICDTLNWHYPSMPFDANSPEDKRPVLLGEYFFPVCHEQTDVRIDPGLRELWGAGKSDPSTPLAKALDAEYDQAKTLMPGAKSDVWSSIYHSKRLIGAAMFAGMDDAFYFPDGTHAGYAWHHGYWGLLDVWRRPKPEYWLNKLIFSPVWFPVRHVPLGAQVELPVENRYAFTDLSELKFKYQIGSKRGTKSVACAPGSTASLKVPIPIGTRAGDNLAIQVIDPTGREVNSIKVLLGSAPKPTEPKPAGGAPKLTAEGDLIIVQGASFGLVLNKKSGQFVSNDPRHYSALLTFPSVHVTRYDFGDLAGPNSPPYSVFPDRATRTVEGVTSASTANAVELTVKEKFKDFVGFTTLAIAANGVGSIRYDYTYVAGEMNCREVGMRFDLRPECQVLSWKRWSEWGVYPQDQISRTEGTATAWRPGTNGPDREGLKPSWPWSQDQTELGTADFRSVKLNIYEAAIRNLKGEGIKIFSPATAHVRACVEMDGVGVQVLSECHMAPYVLRRGATIQGRTTVQLMGR